MEPFSTYKQESGQQIVFVKLEKVRGEGRGVLWSLSTQKIICCNNLPGGGGEGGGGGGGGVVVSGQGTGIWVQVTLPLALHVLGKRKRKRFASHFVIGRCLSLLLLQCNDEGDRERERKERERGKKSLIIQRGGDGESLMTMGVGGKGERVDDEKERLIHNLYSSGVFTIGCSRWGYC